MRALPGTAVLVYYLHRPDDKHLVRRIFADAADDAVSTLGERVDDSRRRSRRGTRAGSVRQKDPDVVAEAFAKAKGLVKA